MSKMPNIPSLLKSLRVNNWYITGFPFAYNQYRYAVVFEDLHALGRDYDHYAVALTFLDMNDQNHKAEFRANANGFDASISEICDFFRIYPGRGNGKQAVLGIYEAFNNGCPDVYPGISEEFRDLLVAHTDRRDGNNGLCCYMARHNPTVGWRQQMRTPVNTAKTRLLRPELFEEIGRDDPNISFCYRLENPLPDAEIIANLHKQH